MDSETICLAKNFSMVAAGGQAVVGDWLNLNKVSREGSEFQNAVLHLHCQTLDPTTAVTGIQAQVESSEDEVEREDAGTAISVSTPGSQDSAISANLKSLVRIKLTNVEAFQMMGIISVWLQLKRE